MIIKGDYKCDMEGEIIAKEYLSTIGIRPIRHVTVDLQINKNESEIV
jgi:hypothetical protein